MTRTRLLPAVAAALFAPACAGPGVGTGADSAVRFPVLVTGDEFIEVVAPSGSTATRIPWLRAEARSAAEAGERAKRIFSFRATLFEDLDGDDALGPSGRTLDWAFGETDEPTWFIEISGLEAPSGSAEEHLRVLAEVETTFGSSSAVFGF